MLNFRRLLTALLAAVLLLPIALLLLGAAGRMLAAVGDAKAAIVLDRMVLAGGLAWVLALVLVIIVLAADRLMQWPVDE